MIAAVYVEVRTFVVCHNEWHCLHISLVLPSCSVLSATSHLEALSTWRSVKIRMLNRLLLTRRFLSLKNLLKDTRKYCVNRNSSIVVNEKSFIIHLGPDDFLNGIDC